MLSFISSSSLARLAVLILTLPICVLGIEAYCHLSSRYQATTFYFLKNAAFTDPTNAVFGDSHVMATSRIPGFSFYGWAGEQPEELNTLVHYLYDTTKPGKIILQADPQWFGQYHVQREKFVTPRNLISRRFPTVLSSAYYWETLRPNLVASGYDVAKQIIPVASAQETSILRARAATAEKKWVELFAQPDFNWTWLTPEARADLTEVRVLEQNPRPDFASSTSAAEFEDAISRLVSRGATVCLFRTPVTQNYLKMTRSIPDSRFAAFNGYINDIAHRYKLRHVDFSALPRVFEDSAFANSDHLIDRESSAVWPIAAHACFD
ncbi:hypothetical protein [Bradyrhizobium japonicum]|uniref:hypothetical protein n=1 Tax=Bradyrhizobium japonicum TaxID=375 RepID=UPI0011DCFE26|nr:hypothetical protein [Bradyrhizobium japonicum]MCD9111507.1 hypothetical protein [Bradyrhizobium japonicum]MCD9255495.1 hypothetical protein [Bradyrhizobium japonicum SEMIA 5079]MCD9821332.1 hypothetical protein [Bradyrhizobium japonicum]MCD9895610.1 hypothetical protein [Bradyrhizobium japonicum]MCD9906912.1 hypothetical protein [Bradyrhizobium japonicum]